MLAKVSKGADGSRFAKNGRNAVLLVIAGATLLVGLAATSTASFVAVGTSGTILTSPTGAAWTNAPLASTQSLHAMVAGGGIFVAVGDAGTIITSTDGLTWSPATSGVTANLSGIAYDGSTWVAVGAAGTILTSTTGSSWTTQCPAGAGTGCIGNPLNAVAYGNGQWVAVGTPMGTGGLAPILTSPNGVAWTSQIGGTNNALLGVGYGASNWIAVGATGTVLNSAAGTTWLLRNSGTTAQLNAVEYAGSQWVAVGSVVLASATADGSAWTPSGGGATFYGLHHAGATWVAVGGVVSSQGSVFTSPDGAAWTSRTSGAAGNLYSVAYDGTRWVYAGQGGAVATSPDAVTWTLTKSGVAATLDDVFVHGSMLVAVGGGNEVLTSTDAVSWVAQKAPLSAGRIVYANGGWMAAYPPAGSVSSGSGTMKSPNGIDWAFGGAPASSGFSAGSGCSGGRNVGLAFGGGQWVISSIRVNAAQSTLFTSPTGAVWTPRSDPTNRVISDVLHDGSQFIAVGGMYTTGSGPGYIFTCANVILTSPDGITWTQRTSPTTNRLLSLAASDSITVAVGDSGAIITSPDGISWTARTSNTIARLFDVAWDGHSFAAVGLGGAIVTSPDGANWTVRTSGTALDIYGIGPGLPVAPLAPTGLVARPFGDPAYASAATKAVRLDWNAPADWNDCTVAANRVYGVYRGPTAGPITTLVANISASAMTYTDTSVAVGSSYAYAVVAGCTSATGVPDSLQATAVAADVKVPNAPAAPGVTSGSVITVSWSAPGANNGNCNWMEGYRVYRSKDGAAFAAYADVLPTGTTWPRNVNAPPTPGWSAPATAPATTYTDTTGSPDPPTYGHTYAYEVSAVNCVGESPLSAPSALIDLGLPDPPATVVAKPYGLPAYADPPNANGPAVRLDWSVVPSPNGACPTITGYNVYRDGSLLTATPLAATSYSDAAVSIGGSYTYKVRSYCSNPGLEGNDSFAAPAQLTLPTAPGQPTITPLGGPFGLRVDWTGVPGSPNNPNCPWMEGYRVLRSVDGSAMAFLARSTATPAWARSVPTGPFSHLAPNPAAATLYDDHSVAVDHTYAYEVKAVNCVGEGPSSPQAAITIVPPSAPTVVVAKPYGAPAYGDPPNPAGPNVRLNWASVAVPAGCTAIDGYYVYRDGVMASGLVPAQSWTDTSVTLGNTYAYAVRSHCANTGVESAASTLATAQVTLPTPPGAATATAVGASTVHVDWSPSPGTPNNANCNWMEGYLVRRSVNGNPPDPALRSSPAPAWPRPVPGGFATLSAPAIQAQTFDDTSATIGNGYSYSITAVNCVGESVPLVATVDLTLPAAPGTVTALPYGAPAYAVGPAVRVDWTPAAALGGCAAIDGYNVFRDASQANAALVTATSFTDAGVAAGATHSYTVRSHCNSPGLDSGPSASATAQLRLPTSPQAPVASLTTPNNIHLDWSSSPGLANNANCNWLEGHRVYRSDNGLPSALLASMNPVPWPRALPSAPSPHTPPATPTMAFDDNTVQAGHTYSYRVAAVNCVGESAPGLPTVIGGPLVVTLTPASDWGSPEHTFQITAGVAGGVPSYSCTWTISPGGQGTFNPPGSSQCATATFMGGASGNCYSIRVDAVDGADPVNPGVSSGNAVAQVCIVSSAGNTAPTAAFSGPSDADVDQGIQFADLSHDADGLVVSWLWDFGDGSTSTSQHPMHSFATPGDYSVRLTVTDDWGVTDSVVHTVHVGLAAAFESSGGGTMGLIADAGEDQTVNEGAMAHLSGHSDSSRAKLHWFQVSGPPVTLLNPGSETPAFLAPNLADARTIVLVFALTATDGAAVSPSDFVTVTIVSTNHAPVAEAGETQTKVPNDDVTLDASESKDADGESLHFEWVQTAGTHVDLVQDGAKATFKAPPSTKDNVLRFKVVVTDTHHAAAEDSTLVILEQPATLAPAPAKAANLAAPQPIAAAQSGPAWAWIAAGAATVLGLLSGGLFLGLRNRKDKEATSDANALARKPKV